MLIINRFPFAVSAHTWYLLMLVCWSLSCPVSAQSPPDYRLISVPDGLSHRDVKYATRDPRGFMWIINSGIDFYDGQSFTSYNKFDPVHYIPIDNIRTGCKVNDSLLVFTASKDLYALNMLTGKVKPMAYPEGMDTDFNDVVNIFDRQHHPNIVIFTRTNSGTIINVIDQQWKYLFSYEVKNDVPLRSKIVRAYANGPEGVIWLLDEAHAQIMRIDPGGVKTIPFPFDVQAPELMYRLVYLPGFGLVICRNNGVIYAVKDGAQEVVEVMQIPLEEKVLNPSHVTQDGWIWSISDHQFIKFNIKTRAYEKYKVKMFGPYHPILRGSYQDQEDITWISTEVGLLEILPNAKPFHAVCNDPTGLRNLQFREIIPAGDNTFICRALGQSRLLLRLSMNESLEIDTIHLNNTVSFSGVLRPFGDYIYHVVSGEQKLERYQISNGMLVVMDLPSRPTTQFYNWFVIDDQGMIWYQNMDNQLTGFHPDSKQTDFIPLKTDNVRTPWRALEFFRSNEIMIATETMGLMFFDRKSGALVRQYNQESTPSLSGNFVNTVYVESDSILWLGTLGAGLNRLNIVTNTNQVFTKLNGLPDNMIASLQRDNKGNIWIGTYNGLSMYNTTEQRFFNYYTEDGLSDNEFNYLSSHSTADGTMLMGSLNGMTIFNPNEIIGNNPLPGVQLTRIQRYNRRKDLVLTQEHEIGAEHIIEVSPYDNYLDLTFAVPSYTNNTSHIFFSRLKGIDHDWQQHGRNVSLRYQQLRPGHYELALIAADAHGNKTAEPVLYKIHVRQIFYKSGWFIASVMSGILCIVFFLYKYRLRVLQRELETRTRIASDLHDEVGGSLTGLYLQMQMMEMNASEQERSKLGKANAIINEAITKMRDLVWSIDARSDTWGKMMERMEDYASDVLSPLDIQMTIQHETIHRDTPIDARTKHNLYLIYKEAIHNIAKHSNASAVEILIIRNPDHLTFIVQDNGTVTDIRSSSGQGLQNMKMRAARLKGKVIAAPAENGFRVEVEIPDA